MKRKDLAPGIKFGCWTVLSRVENPKHRSKYVCQCSCGTIRQVERANLVSGASTKCRPCIKLPLGEACFRGRLRQYKAAAVVRGFEFSLSDELAKQLFLQDCAYCGAPPAKLFEVKGCRGTALYNGIDRRDSCLGYIESNVVACCATCNYMKRSMTVEEFIAHARQIVENQR